MTTGKTAISVPLLSSVGSELGHPLPELLDGIPFRTRPGDEFADELSQSFFALRVVHPDLLFRDECARALLRRENASNLEFFVRAHYGVGVDGEIHSQLPHGRQLVAGTQYSRGDRH